jgi:hypothetical protein
MAKLIAGLALLFLSVGRTFSRIVRAEIELAFGNVFPRLRKVLIPWMALPEREKEPLKRPWACLNSAGYGTKSPIARFA